MVRSSVAALLLLVALVALPQHASAGGTEFPGDGTRNLGRGGAGMARADDPSVMIRNPALLADLWGDQALLGAHLLLVDSCFRPSGGYGIGTTGTDVARVGGEIIILRPPVGATWPDDGSPVVGYQDEPYPTVCYEGPSPFLPRVGLSMKLGPDLGVGLGFFPPDNTSLNQWGNRDGTVDTENGLRPNPLRFIRTHLNTSYFSVLGAVGYRINDFIRIGFGFQWQLVVFQSRSVTPAVSVSGLAPTGDVRTSAFGRDLFVPGLIGSIHIKPFDALDIALGAKWSDRVMGKTKLDLESGAFGVGAVTELNGPNGDVIALGSTLPSIAHNQGAEVSAGPVWVPQLSAGIRFADRLKPRVRDENWAEVQKSGGDTNEDSMDTERWDIELDVVYYLTSFQDRTDVSTRDATIALKTIDERGNEAPPVFVSVGDCINPKTALAPGEACKQRQVRTRIEGQDQITVRLGGDYNVLPGVFTVRAGGSYETDGQKPSWMSPFQYMAGRMGLHAGFTVRFMERTDLSFGFAHFIQKEVRLQIDPERAGDFRVYQATDPERYHLAMGELDGTAKIEIPNSSRPTPGPYYVNAGSYYYDLSVLSMSISQKF